MYFVKCEQGPNKNCRSVIHAIDNNKYDKFPKKKCVFGWRMSDTSKENEFLASSL
ncbi:7506_t:CDS:2 [Racocetra persica]|uniref:7506_t:CDS:1 n=1 Tax=Racocetra persica TaxID=160502 RepID=A0ACA9NWD0_9GLOM|nr:7506_t:CDS:2 [Racocetra persica]